METPHSPTLVRQQPQEADAMTPPSLAARSRKTKALEAGPTPTSPMQSFKQQDRVGQTSNNTVMDDDGLSSTMSGDGSPTRVADFDAVVGNPIIDEEENYSYHSNSEGSPVKGWRPHKSHRVVVVESIKDKILQDDDNAFALQSGLAPPDISRTPFDHTRRGRERRHMLPTLLETSSTSSAEESPRKTKSLGEFFSSQQPNAIVVNTNSSRGPRGEDDSEVDDDSFFIHDESVADEKENRQCVRDESDNGGEGEIEETVAPLPLFQSPSRNQVEVLRIKEQAAQLALRGREQEAIDAYRVALRMTRMDLKRIKDQLHAVKRGKTHDQRRKQDALHEDWWNVAIVVAEIRTMMGILYERLGYYDRAIVCCKEAREVCERQAHLDRVRRHHHTEKKSEDDHTFGPLEKVAQLTHMLKQLEVAKSSFVQRRSLHEAAIQLRQRIAKLRAQETKAQPSQFDALYKYLLDTLSQVLELEMDNLGSSHPQVADTLSILSDVHAEKGDWDTAIDTLHRALSIVQLALGETHPGTAEKLRKLASFYQKRQQDANDTETAMGYYNEAIAAYKDSCGGHSRLIGSTLNDLAVLHIQRQEYDEAAALLSDALVEFDSVTTSTNGIHSDTAQIWRNLGECYSRRQEWDSAALAYKNALEVQRNARRCYETLIQEHRQKMQQSNNPEDVDILVRPLLSDDDSIADTLKRLAKVYSAVGKYNKACVVLNDALYLYQVGYHVARGAKSETKTEKNASLLCKNQDQIAHTLYCIAEIQEKRGLHDNAINVYSEALQLRLFSDAQRCLNDRGERENMVHCAMCLAGIGSVHMNRKEYADARRVYNDAMKFCKAHGVPSSHKIVEMLTKRLAEAELLAKAAEYTVDRRGGEYLKTSSSYSLASSKGSNESMGATKSDKTIMWEQIAQDCMLRGEYDQCVKLLITILATRKKLLRRKKKEAGRDHCQKERDDLARTLVNFGTVLSRKGENQEALVAFQEALRLYEANGMEKSHPIRREVEKELNTLTSAMPAFLI